MVKAWGGCGCRLVVGGVPLGFDLPPPDPCTPQAEQGGGCESLET